MRFASIGRASAVLLSIALAGVGAERTAAACQGVTVGCPEDTPICVGGSIFDPTAGTCEVCSSTTLTQLCSVGTTCQTSGACTSNCTADYDAAASSNSCTALNPACTGGTCKQCVANTPNDKHCPSTTPDCNADNLCGCTSNNDCPSGSQCNPAAGVYGVGECETHCLSDNGCTPSRKYCVVDGGDDLDGSADGICVACLPGMGCDFGYECDSTSYTCVAVAAADAGSDGGTGEDGGGPVAGNDAGALTDGGSSNRDATVGDGGEGETGGSDIYRDGTTEGGGCSLLPGAGAPGRTPVVSGFAGLAGLLFLRRSQRRSDRKRNARR